MTSERGQAIIGAIGLVFCGLAVVLNEFVLARILYQESRFDPGHFRTAVWVCDLVVFGFGVALVALRRRAVAINLALVSVSLLVLAPLIGELVFRLGITTNLQAFRNPRMYAGWYDDEDQWKLRFRWLEKGVSAIDRKADFDHHPMLGWVPSQHRAPVDPDRPTVLLFGDSFMHGSLKLDPVHRIPALLNDHVPECSVVSHAASGYGLDQIYLSFKTFFPEYRSQQEHRSPFIVLGILTLDLDRSIFTVRDAPKPYFVIEDGDLKLQGVPINETPDVWHANHPPSIHSYFGAFIMRSLREAACTGPLPTEIRYRQRHKKEINAKILEAVARLATDNDLSLLVVMFYPRWELAFTGWREEFLKSKLDALGVPYLDTKELLVTEKAIQAVQAGQMSKWSMAKCFYQEPPDGHPNGDGNRVIATAMAARVRSQFDLGEEIPLDQRLSVRDFEDGSTRRWDQSNG